MSLHVLIPCKGLAAGKSRLAAVLDDAARARLCAGLLRQTLAAALGLVPAAACHLVSSDGEAVALAAAAGVAAIADRGHGLNAALAEARALLRDADPAASLLVLPIDLPRAGAAALGRLVALPGEVVAAPDRHGRGTNALYLSPAAAGVMAFRFGEESFAAHRAAAARAGLRFAVSADPDLAFDLDEPEDLAAWQSERRAS
jgi:2-phospho-L-lactate guanylyltransferase